MYISMNINDKPEPVTYWDDGVRVIMIWCARGDSNPHVRTAH